MMSKKSPQLRFEGFTDDWELRKLGEVYNFQYGQFNNNPDNGGQYPIYGANGIIGGYDEYNSENAIVIGHMGAYAGHVLWAEGKHFVTYNGTMGIADKSILNSNFGYYLVVSVNVPKLTAGSGQPFVSYSDLNGIKILIPTIEEQQKIGSFFKQLDNTIALHQRKLDLLKEQKKGYLQKMFPKNGAKVPELRFAGFADDWEERKLSDLFIKGGSGGTPKSTNKAFYDGDIPFLGISDITKSNGFINNTEKHISSDGLNSSAAWIVSKGAISLAMYASVGKLAILNIDAATSQAFYNMIFDDYDLRDLVYQRLNKANELSEWNKLISTGTQSNLNADKVKNFQMYLPKNHDEIKLISTFFKQIDNTVALHQRKLDLLKEQKKGFLQKMFV